MIPHWNNQGVLPPVRPEMPGHTFDRSPYIITLLDAIEHFSSSPERMVLLQGLLQFRAELHAMGVVTGFQWLDGSFLEQVELLEARAPADIDVVSYFYLPPGKTESEVADMNPMLFDQDWVKASFHVDHYSFVLGKALDAFQIRQISYWYSMWSHRRDGLWKGFLQIDLDPAEDEPALQALTSKLRAGGLI